MSHGMEAAVRYISRALGSTTAHRHSSSHLQMVGTRSTKRLVQQHLASMYHCHTATTGNIQKTLRSWSSRSTGRAEAEALSCDYAVARSTKRMKAGQPFELIRVAPQQAGTSFRARDMAQPLHSELPEDPTADVGGLFQEDMTNFGPEDAPRERRRAPGLVRGEPFEAYRVIHIHNSRRLN